MSTFYGTYPGGGGGGGGSSLTFIDSIVNNSGTVSLVNDSAAPGNSQYYGTNSSGTKGFFPLSLGTPFQESLGNGDGSKTSFPLSKTPLSQNALDVYVDGIIQPVVTVWSISGTNVIFVTAPAGGQSVYVVYAIAPTGGGSSTIEAHGSFSSPIQIVPGTGLVATSANDQVWWIAPLSGGATPVTAAIQISGLTVIGQRITLKGTSSSNYYAFSDGNGLSLNGPIDLTNNNSIELMWDGTQVSENSRRA